MVRLEKNSGPGLARKLGHCLARGRYLQFLDSDDLISEQKIAVQSAFLEENPDLVMTYCLSHYLEDNNPTSTSRVLGRTEREFHRILPEALKGIIWQTSSCLWRAKAVNSDNWKGLYWAEDILFDILTGLEDRPIAKTPGSVPLTFKRVDNTGLSHSLAFNKKAQLDILRTYDIIWEIAVAKGPALKDGEALMELIARRYLGKIMIFLTFRNHQAVIHCIESVRAIRPDLLPLDARAAYLIYRASGIQAGFSLLRKWRWLGKKMRNFQGRLSSR
jgi:glycosyltransferase involved in cell wall biosynthesis